MSSNFRFDKNEIIKGIFDFGKFLFARNLNIFILLLGTTISLLKVNAQIPTFQSTLTVSTPVCPGANAFSPVNGLVLSSLSRGPGLGCINHSFPVGNNAESWSTGATLLLSDDDYFEFTLSGAGCPFRLDSLRLWLRKSANNPPQRVAFYYLLNNGAPQAMGSAIDLSAFGNSTIFSLTIPLTSSPSLTATDQITIRMYGWQASSSTGTLRWVSQTGNETIVYGSFPSLSAGMVSSDQTICPGNSGTLTLSGFNGLIQRWEYANPPYAGWNAIGNSSSTQAYSGLTQDSRYRALVSCGTNMDTSAHAELTWGLASAVLSGDHTICTGPPADLTVQLTGIPPWDLTWSDGINSFTQNGISNSPWIISVNPVQSTTYSLIQVNNICGTASPLSGNPRVVKGYTHLANLSGSQNFCGTSGTGLLQFNFSAFPPWNIQYSDGTTVYSISGISTSPAIIPVNVTSNTTYTLLNSYSGVCQGNVSGIAELKLNPIPTAQVSGPQIICRPNALQLSFTLTGSPPWNLTWTDGSVQYSMQGIYSSPMVMNVANPGTGAYTLLTVSDSFCVGSGGSTSSIIVADPPTAALSGNSTICQGQTGQAIVVLTGSPPWSIDWSDGTTNQTITGITNANYILNVSPQISSTYQLQIVSDNQCGTGIVGGNAAVSLLLPASANFRGDTAFCKGGEGILSVDLSGDSPWQITISENGLPQQFSGITQNPWTINSSPNFTTEYVLTQVGNVCGTQNIQDTVRIGIYEIPDWTLSGPEWICEGEEAELTLNFSGTGPWTYYFSKNSQPDSIPGIPESPYFWAYTTEDSLISLEIGGIRNSNCQNNRKDSFNIAVYPKPYPAFTCRDSNLFVLFNPTLTELDSLRWDLGDGTERVDSFPVHEYFNSGKYLVGLTMFLGKCTNRLDSLIEVRKPYMDYVVVYKNPSDGDFAFSVNYLNSGDKVNIALITREGEIIFEENAQAEGNRVWREVRLKGEICPGLYILRIINKFGIFRTKLIIGA